MISSTYVSLF